MAKATVPKPPPKSNTPAKTKQELPQVAKIKTPVFRTVSEMLDIAKAKNRKIKEDDKRIPNKIIGFDLWKYIDSGNCPNCDKPDRFMEDRIEEVNHAKIIKSVVCTNCGSSWTNVYELKEVKSFTNKPK
jgi:hypothetical protein